MSSVRATQTLDSVHAALHSRRTASMADLVRIVHALAQEENEVSVGQLAELIEHDSGVLDKVISAANTFGYNPYGVRITNISEAIQIIGFSRVRRLAMSLLLLEHAGRSSTDGEQREMAAKSLCSAMIAQVASEQMSLVDPEQAFVCAALRNFGRLVLGAVMKDRVEEARELAERERTDDEAYRTVFGLTPLELGHELLRSSSLPEPILNAIRDLPPETLEKAAWAERRLAHLARFSLQLSELVLNPTLSPADFGIASTELVQRYGAEIPSLHEFFPDLLKQAESRLAIIARSAGSDTLDRYGLDRLRRRVSGDSLVARTSTGPANLTPARPTAASTPIPPVTSMEEACDLLTHGQAGLDPIAVALAALQVVLQPTDLFYCAFEAAQGEFRLQQGQGRLAAALQGKALFRRHERNVFLLCHERLENVVVRDAMETKLQAYLPPWLRTSDAPKAFVLLPLHHLGKIQGVILAGWNQPVGMSLTAERVPMIRKLLAATARSQLMG